MSAPDPSRTVISPQLMARWFVELADLIREDGQVALRAVELGPNGRYESMTDTQRERLRQIMNDLLVRLADHNAITPDRVSILARVQRDHIGRVVATVPIGAPAGSAGIAGMCVCGNPSALGTVHRSDGPCFYPETVTGEAVDQS